jgi:peptide/nickel transport system substrate-binding protein
MNVRAVFEAFDRYWGGPPPIKRVTVEVVQDVFARVASLESRRADLAVDLPIREITRLAATPGFVGRIDPVSDIVILELTRTGLFQRQEPRLAAHHAIDKQAISRALFAGKALPIDVAAAHGTPGYPENFRFPYDPAKAAALVRQAGFGPDNPARMGFYATKGVFPNDFELAQAIAGMWRKVGIEANPEPVALAKYFELQHATKLPEAMLYSWGNTTGDRKCMAVICLIRNRRSPPTRATTLPNASAGFWSRPTRRSDTPATAISISMRSRPARSFRCCRQ